MTYTATDIHGNSSTATVDVIVEDHEGPTIVTPAADETVECDGSGNTAALTAWLSNNAGATATDACSGVTWSNDFTTMANTCGGGAGAVQVIFTATDAAGNTSSTSATFTIEDTTAPTITAAASDLTVECDGAGNTSDLNMVRQLRRCDRDRRLQQHLLQPQLWHGSQHERPLRGTGSVTVTFTATDVCGNESTTSATFTIEDTTNPTALAKDHTVTLNASGNGTMVAGDIDNGSSDGCGTVTLAAARPASPVLISVRTRSP